MTIKPLVELLEVKRKKRALPTVSEEIHSRVRNDILLSEHPVFGPSDGGLHVAGLLTSPGSASNQCLLKSAL